MFVSCGTATLETPNGSNTGSFSKHVNDIPIHNLRVSAVGSFQHAIRKVSQTNIKGDHFHSYSLRSCL